MKSWKFYFAEEQTEKKISGKVIFSILINLKINLNMSQEGYEN